MILTIITVVVGVFVIPGVLAGIYYDFKYNDYANKLGDWRFYAPDSKLRGRDSHAKMRRDEGFVDGMITGAILEEIDDMFK